MKKLNVSVAILLAVLSIGSFAFNTNAQTVCPAGYTCSQVTTTILGCPDGYVCTPSSTVTTPTTISPAPSYSGDVLVHNTSSTCYYFSNNLTIGSFGADVVALQSFLLGKGFSIPALSSGAQSKGYYSYQTAAALAQYQTSVGISPAQGYFGALTRAQINKACGATTVSAQPTITRIAALASSDSQIYASERFSIEGTNFTGSDSVYVGNESATVTQDGTALIWAVAPSDLKPNSATAYVYVKNSNGTSQPFSVVLAGGSTVSGSATAAVTGTPTLALTYDSLQRESTLNAIFNVTFTTGSASVQVYFNGSGITATDGIHTMNVLGSLVPSQTLVNDGSNYTVPANTTVTFTATGHFSPRSMFAGSYSATLSGIYLNGLSVTIPVNTNRTNTVTIVGETSPYITYISPTTVASGGTITVGGTRLANATVWIDGSATASANLSGNSTSFSFPLPSSVTAPAAGLNAGHQLQLKGTDGQASNQVGFTVSGGTTVTPPTSGTISVSPASMNINATVGQSTNVATLQGSGSTYIAWMPLSGSLPPGIYTSVAGSTGLSILGMSSQAGNYSYTVKAADFYNPNNYVPVTINFTVTTGTVTTASCPAGYVCTPAGQSSSCPSGYTCTQTTANCPSGYTCTVYSTTPTTVDVTAPSTPTGLTAIAVSSSQINLSWNPSSDNVGVIGYKVYSNGSLLGTAGNAIYSINGLPASTQYSYTVAAIDAAGNVSSQSSSASATTQGVSGGGTVPVAPILLGVNPIASAPDGQTAITVQGAGFTSATRVYFYTASLGATAIVPTSVTNGGATLTFVIPTSVAPGYYYAWVSNVGGSTLNATGNTSMVTFNVLAPTATAPTTISVTPSNLSVHIQQGKSYDTSNVIWTGSGSTQVSWRLAGGSFPPGTTWNYGGTTFELIGTPNTPGTYNFSFTASDFYGKLSPTTVSGTVIVDPSVTATPTSSTISLDVATPLVATVPVTDTVNGQYLGLPILLFDVKAQGDQVHLSNVKVNISGIGSGIVGAAYLFQGSTQVSSAAVFGGAADFQIANGTPGAAIPSGTSVPYTVKVDVTNLTSGQMAVSASVNGTAPTAILNSQNAASTIFGSATGNAQTVVAAGPFFTLVGTPTITKTNISSGNGSVTTFQYTGSFNVNVQAIGSSVTLGLPSSASPAFAANLAQAYTNGAPDSSISLLPAYPQPGNTTLGSDGKSFVVAQNQSVTVPVTYSFTVTNGGANTEAVQINGIQWSSSAGGAVTTVNFMAGQPSWRTSAVMLYTPSNLSVAPVSQDVLTASIWDAIRAYYANQ